MFFSLWLILRNVWSFLLIIAIMCIGAYFFLFFLFVICWAFWALELVTFNSFWKFSAIVSLKVVSSPFYVIFLEIKHILDFFHVIFHFLLNFLLRFPSLGSHFNISLYLKNINVSCVSCIAGGFFTTSHWETHFLYHISSKIGLETHVRECLWLWFLMGDFSLFI